MKTVFAPCKSLQGPWRSQHFPVVLNQLKEHSHRFRWIHLVTHQAESRPPQEAWTMSSGSLVHLHVLSFRFHWRSPLNTMTSSVSFLCPRPNSGVVFETHQRCRFGGVNFIPRLLLIQTRPQSRTPDQSPASSLQS